MNFMDVLQEQPSPTSDGKGNFFVKAEALVSLGYWLKIYNRKTAAAKDKDLKKIPDTF